MSLNYSWKLGKIFCGISLIKKIYYWPRGFHVGIINKCFSTKNIGYVVFLSGEWDEMEFNIFVIKKPY